MKRAWLVVLFIPSFAFAQELFGAVAYSAKERQHGWSNNYASRKAAEEAAMDACRKNADDCKNILWFRNACGALVTGPDGFGADWAESQANAVNKALKTCTRKSASCAVTLTFCTGK